ncbi:hypothetical protein [Leadbettera azotonutricia]|uniref:Uncharacterized protein n=1 Tax=Leadbettera azotonutricia (strain ATCC BAA-888 / DSM 13862 / ZAS-9) TaxID=545695 RepID=F5Y977_LEAAZ|nr:hypothetical protein [Leadbettera azotonutricia]AEF81936.1 hypothetical protein TREAZ_3243 [Leadbettera azotonutricia ZAS-9]
MTYRCYSKETREGFGGKDPDRDDPASDASPEIAKTLELQKINSRRAKAVAAAGMMGFATIFGACKQPTDSTTQQQPKACECPNGTEHPYGTTMPCCDGEDCTCTVAQLQKPAFEDFFLFDGTISQLVKDQFISAYATLDAEFVVDLKNNYKSPVYVYGDPNNYGDVYDDSIVYFMGEITLQGNHGELTAAILKTMLDEYKADPYNKLVALKSNNKQFLALGKQFNNAKNTVRLSRAAFSRPQLQA